MHNSGTSNANRSRQWFLAVRIGLILLLLLTVAVSFGEEGEQAPDVQSQISNQTIREAHDELIMLLTSLVVIIEILAGYQHFLKIPHRYLLLCSFGAFVLSALCTVFESFVFYELLNYTEHTSVAVGSILLAVWCARVFAFGRQEQRR